MLCHYAEHHYAECRILFTIVLSVIMLSVIMLSVLAPEKNLSVANNLAYLAQPSVTNETNFM